MGILQRDLIPVLYDDEKGLSDIITRFQSKRNTYDYKRLNFQDVILGVQKIAVDGNKLDWGKVSKEFYWDTRLDNFFDLIGALYSELTSRGCYNDDCLAKLRIRTTYSNEYLTLREILENPKLWEITGNYSIICLNIPREYNGFIKRTPVYRFEYIDGIPKVIYCGYIF